MNVAAELAKRGTCPSAQVGAVAALDGRILATGYNGAPTGLPHCTHDPRSGNTPPDATTCRTAVHAEANLVAFAARVGARLEGSTVYTTLSPCLACAHLLLNAGVSRVVARAMYRDQSCVDVFSAVGLRFQLLAPGEPLVSVRTGPAPAASSLSGRFRAALDRW